MTDIMKFSKEITVRAACLIISNRITLINKVLHKIFHTLQVNNGENYKHNEDE